MVWFVADTHFCHDAAPTFEGRQFPSLIEMHKAIIYNWNLVVLPDDIVYVLGDYMFGKDMKALTGITRALNGKKILIRGNHDTFAPSAYISAGFFKYYDVPILFANEFLLSHEPVLAIQGDGLINIHGHTHLRQFTLQCPKHFCVSLECINMRPISYKEILKRKAMTV